jgi:hypothetical protein
MSDLSSVSQLNHIGETLGRLVQMAETLRADSDGHVRRSVQELHAVFTARGAIEPAVARVRESLTMLRIDDRAGSRRQFQRRAPSLEYLGYVIEQELMPDLRRLGFDV